MAAKRRSKGGKGGRGGIDLRSVKALTHPLRVEVLGILNERIASPNELANELDEGLSQVSYHVKVLRDYECIELVKTEPRRGAVEHYYRATSRAFISDRDWPKLPSSIRPGMSADQLDLILGDGVAALKDGTLDERDDRHVSRTQMIVDERGWKDLVSTMDATLKQIDKIQSESSSRLRKSGDSGVTVSASLLGFEVPEPKGADAKSAKGKSKGKGSRGAKRKKA